jgi:hypothetical protein
MCHEIAKTLVKSHNRVLQLTKLIKRMDQVLIETQNEVKALLKQRGALNKELSNTMQKRMAEASERASRVAQEISSALGKMTGDMYENIDYMDEYEAELLVRQGTAAAAAAEGDGFMSDDDLKELVTKMMDEYMDQKCELSLDMQVLSAPIVVRPFCGPLLQQEEQGRMLLAGKRKRDDDLEQKRQSIQLEVASLVMLLRVAEDTPGILQAADAIQNMKGYKELIQELTKEQVTSIMKILTTTQNVDSRLSSMAKLSCAQHFTKIQTLENKCKILKSAFAKAMELSVLMNYVTETGHMNWNKITEDLGDRLADLATAMEP